MGAYGEVVETVSVAVLKGCVNASVSHIMNLHTLSLYEM